MRDRPGILGSLLCRIAGRESEGSQRLRATWVLHGQCMQNSSEHWETGLEAKRLPERQPPRSQVSIRGVRWRGSSPYLHHDSCLNCLLVTRRNIPFPPSSAAIGVVLDWPRRLSIPAVRLKLC
jgi:hypothetical protein